MRLHQVAIPIIENKMDEALRMMDYASKVVNIVELRIDYMCRPNLAKLLGHSKISKIVTNRHPKEGGRFEGSESRRIALLQEAIDLGADYVDIENNFFKPLKRENHNTGFIISHHDFKSSPTPERLERIYNSINKKIKPYMLAHENELATFKPDVAKISMKANIYRDNFLMLDFMRNHTGMIGICIGEEGKPSRVLGPIYGGFLTYAALNEFKISTKGQPTVKELKRAWDAMGYQVYRK